MDVDFYKNREIPPVTSLIQVWLHVMACGTGPLIAAEIHGRLLSSGLYGAASTINMTIVGADQDRALLKTWILPKYSKYRVAYESSCLTDYEWPAMLGMEHDAPLLPSGAMFCYIHTKGASNDSRPDVDVRIQRNIARWRDELFTSVINDWKENVKILEKGCQTCGPFLTRGDTSPLYRASRRGSIPMYSGNMWWSTSAHIMTLPKIIQEELVQRNIPEWWIQQEGSKHFCTRVLPQKDLYDFKNLCGERGPF